MTYKQEENYCTFFPEEMFGVRYNYACYLHDRHYRNEVIERKTRKEADVLLREVIFDYFKKADKKIKGFFVSWIAYIAVRLFGGKHYV